MGQSHIFLAAVRQAGGPTRLGFANPMLYRAAAAGPGAFNDVTDGDFDIGHNYVGHNYIDHNYVVRPTQLT